MLLAPGALAFKREPSGPASLERVSAASAPAFIFRCGGATDIGGRSDRQNQDDLFTWENEDGTVCVLAVLDGHGRESGSVASKAARASFEKDFRNPEVIAKLLEYPRQTFTEVFENAHQAILQV